MWGITDKKEYEQPVEAVFSPVTLAYFSLALPLADQIKLILYLLNSFKVHKKE